MHKTYDNAGRFPCFFFFAKKFAAASPSGPI